MKVAICSGRISGRWLEQGNELNKIKGVVESKYIFDQIMIKTCFHVNWSENPKVFNKKNCAIRILGLLNSGYLDNAPSQICPKRGALSTGWVICFCSIWG